MKLKHLICSTLLALTPVSAIASEAKSIDFTSPIISPDGTPYRECITPADNGAGCAKDGLRAITLGAIVSAVLSRPQTAHETALTLDEQVKRGTLALRLRAAKDATVTIEERSLIEKQLGAAGLNSVQLVLILHALGD